LAFFATMLLAVWALRRLHNTAFLFVIPLAFAKPPAVSAKPLSG
jgi:hypothetical protein